ncbi:pyridine nucleotide-disulfide oxidoreductase/dicluster-binding protein [Fundidesulfovibrio terrae]|uniref:pyridine nucleotide-disulfide oxidoreductase/dicluster-binding protein n=1 Tax=Fundidesulfovibrio terrae TaxID=2922866 RepID=UPI001FAF56AF|nr:pyridine nucleotide-disulfide oxidoreductase/dicluster-binding protein [Fundidesulfovibrio terrae]
MEQQDLRDWERRCIQEEPPWCQAACPIHVDARAFMERMKAGDFDAARKILEKTMPLPAVLGAICDHPCEDVCKRREAGEPLAIGALERACVRLSRPGPKPLVLPGKGKMAGVLGSDLSALTCAWDLIRKGFGVTMIFPGDAPGGRLRAMPEDILPPADLEREIARMSAMGLEFRPGQEFSPQIFEEARRGFDAVFVEYGAPWCPARRDDVDPLTLRCPDAGRGAGPSPSTGPGQEEAGASAVFCGGWPAPDGTFSAISEAADGRRAAASMDRHMSGASLTASREKEGPVATRLFTSLKGVELSARIVPAGAEGLYSAGEAASEAARCLDCQCLECVKVCAYLEHYKGYPKKYARQIYNNAAIVQGVHQANTMINSCSLCGLCAEVCPERFHMGDLCITARRDMVERAKMPPSAHEFALEDMAASNSEGFALARNAPGKDASAFLFFPGCQLAASHPHHAASVYAFLRQRLPGGVGLMLRCCGIPARWAGRDDLFDESAEQLRALWKGLGAPRVITACSSCLAVFRERLPELAPMSLWEAFGQTGLPSPSGARPAGPVAVHDPCTLRHDEPVRQAVRRALRHADVPFEELALSGQFTECCGYGGLMGNANPAMARTVAARRAGETPLDVAASCSMCRDRLSAEGKRAWHVLDFLFPAPETDPAAKGPGFSQRHENRARLKEALLHEVWGEETSGGPDRVAVSYAPGVPELMEERRILREDVQAVLGEAERTGRMFVEKASGRMLASLRPRRVTYWVEYRRESAGLLVTRAWSHRMELTGPAGDGGQGAHSGQTGAGGQHVYLPGDGDWSCSCGTQLVPGPVVAGYLGSAFTITLLTCPGCGLVLAPENLALGKMAEVEQLLEDK